MLLGFGLIVHLRVLNLLWNRRWATLKIRFSIIVVWINDFTFQWEPPDDNYFNSVYRNCMNGRDGRDGWRRKQRTSWTAWFRSLISWLCGETPEEREEGITLEGTSKTRRTLESHRWHHHQMTVCARAAPVPTLTLPPATLWTRETSQSLWTLCHWVENRYV